MKIAFVWEFGGGMGHFSEIIPIAVECIRRGHIVTLIVKSLRNIEKFMGDFELDFIQAPNEVSQLIQKFPITANYSQLLHNLGFGDQQHLLLKATAWRNLFRLIKPDLVVCNHAPIAMLALQSLNIQHLNLGTGFTCPPNHTSLPVLRTDYNPPDEIVAAQEQKLLNNSNHFLNKYGASILVHLKDVFPKNDQTYLATYQELDHFPVRTNPRYWGTWPTGIGEAPVFPKGTGPTVFGYLKPFKALEVLLTELNRLKLPTLICDNGISKSIKLRFTSETLKFETGPVELSAALKACDFAILNATHGVLSATLVAGKPSMNIPLQLEQGLLAKAVTSLKAGISVASHDGNACIQGLHFMLENHGLLQAEAAKIAAKYQDIDPKSKIVDLVDDLEKISGYK